MISFAVLTEARGRPAGLARPFSRQPGWDQTEGLLAGWSRNGLPSVLLNDEPTATLGGLTQSVAQTVAVLMDLARRCCLSGAPSRPSWCNRGHSGRPTLKDRCSSLRDTAALLEVQIWGLSM
jgi:hypothetical protein